MKNSGFVIDTYASLEENWDRLLAQYPHEWPYVMPRAFRELYDQALDAINQQIYEEAVKKRLAQARDLTRNLTRDTGVGQV